VLFSTVFAAAHPRRSLDSFFGLTPICCPLSPKSFSLYLFADPHPVNPVVSTFYKNLEGRGAFLVFEPANIQPSNPKFGSWKGLRDLPTCLAKSHGIKSLTDPHPLTLLESYRFKNSAGRGCSPCFNSFSCNTYGFPRKCCKQKTYNLTKPFKCNTYAKRGGRGPVIVN